MIFFLNAGCASFSNGTKPPNVIDNKAIIFINDSLVNHPKASGSIRNLDDTVISTYFSLSQPNKVEVAPGEHEISVGFYSRGYRADATVEATFKRGHVYEIQAILSKEVKNDEIKYDVLLIDVMGAKSKILNKQKVLGTRAP
jgi:hypothetical protein